MNQGKFQGPPVGPPFPLPYHSQSGIPWVVWEWYGSCLWGPGVTNENSQRCHQCVLDSVQNTCGGYLLAWKDASLKGEVVFLKPPRSRFFGGNTKQQRKTVKNKELFSELVRMRLVSFSVQNGDFCLKLETFLGGDSWWLVDDVWWGTNPKLPSDHRSDAKPPNLWALLMAEIRDQLTSWGW